MKIRDAGGAHGFIHGFEDAEFAGKRRASGFFLAGGFAATGQVGDDALG